MEGGQGNPCPYSDQALKDLLVRFSKSELGNPAMLKLALSQRKAGDVAASSDTCGRLISTGADSPELALALELQGDNSLSRQDKDKALRCRKLAIEKAESLSRSRCVWDRQAVAMLQRIAQRCRTKSGTSDPVRK